MVLIEYTSCYCVQLLWHPSSPGPVQGSRYLWCR
jgi:hypothetical protein